MLDIRLNYIEKGDGQPLIFLHGNGENCEYFVNQIDYFSRSYRVIALDTRGHGMSPRGTSPFTLEQFAEDLKDFLDFMKIGKALICGFSDGANIALIIALKYPHMTDKLILNGANLSPAGVKAFIQLPICLGYAVVSLISFFDKKAVPKKELLGLMVNQPDIRPESLSALDVPTLVIVGTHDMIKDSHSALIANSIKNSQLVRLDGDHFIASKNSIDFNAALYRFLKG